MNVANHETKVRWLPSEGSSLEALYLLQCHLIYPFYRMPGHHHSCILFAVADGTLAFCSGQAFYEGINYEVWHSLYNMPFLWMTHSTEWSVLGSCFWEKGSNMPGPLQHVPVKGSKGGCYKGLHLHQPQPGKGSHGHPRDLSRM